MGTFQKALDMVKSNRRAYITINLLYYGVIILAMVYAFFDRPTQQSVLTTVGEGFLKGPLAQVGQVYEQRQLIWATAVTFGVNLFLGSFVAIMLPSLILPFSGFLVGGVRAVVWGLLFSPTSLEVSGQGFISFLFILVLLFLEGQGYVLAMLAAYIQGKAFLSPISVGETSHAQGYLVGLKRAAYIFLLVAMVLILAALYEAAGVILAYHK
jgi:hypothetical protein